MRLLFDVNVWIALAIEDHPSHLVARAWFEGLSDDDAIYFCRVTQQGFFRLLTDRKLFGRLAVSNEAAWSIFVALKNDPRIRWADEPDGLEEMWGNYARRHTSSPGIWTDAYLAAFARLHGFRLASFDRGFKAYKDLDWIEPR